MATKKKLQDVNTIHGSWAGKVHFEFLGCATWQIIYVGLKDGDRLKAGTVTHEQVLAGILDYPANSIKILGVEPNKGRKAVSPFSR